MQTAPARIIRSAHTVAKIGLLMKKSTKPAHPLLGCRHNACSGITSHNRVGLTDRPYGRAVDQELDTRSDDLFPSLQAVGNGIFVSNRVAKRNRALLGNSALASLG